MTQVETVPVAADNPETRRAIVRRRRRIFLRGVIGVTLVYASVYSILNRDLNDFVAIVLSITLTVGIVLFFSSLWSRVGLARLHRTLRMHPWVPATARCAMLHVGPAPLWAVAHCTAEGHDDVRTLHPRRSAPALPGPDGGDVLLAGSGRRIAVARPDGSAPHAGIVPVLAATRRLIESAVEPSGRA